MKTRVIRRDGETVVVIPAELPMAQPLPDEVFINVRGGEIVITVEQSPTLEELVAGITDENRHEETDWGPPVGKEIW
jgi:antitoxin component of MazEF toxin-antitoxin module